MEETPSKNNAPKIFLGGSKSKSPREKNKSKSAEIEGLQRNVTKTPMHLFLAHPFVDRK